MISQNILTDELDFAQIKENLKTFLRGQSTLTDYDFDGSIMSVLLDILAYNTHYNALYTNLAINEMFIDSASKRTSVTSIAKLMGYNSKSIVSARAKVNINVSVSNDNTYSHTIPIGTTFASTNGTKSLTFVTTSAVSATRLGINDEYVFNNVELVEGSRSRLTYTASLGSQFVIPSRKADVSSLTVKVLENAYTDVSVPFMPAQSILHVKADSAVYFVKQREDLFYEIYFGDGIFGKAIQDGNLIVLEYNLSNGTLGNRANSFVYASGASSVAVYLCNTVSIAMGGADEESVESIKYNAPRAFTAQNRAVTASDYSAVLLDKYSNVQCVNVWGGQDHVPPVYGKVFISAKPIDRDAFSLSEKNDMLNNILNDRSMITVTPEFIDPEYINVELNANVYYNPSKTTLGGDQIRSKILTTITDYSNSLGKFDALYRHSMMSRLIDTTDKAIVSNISTIKIHYTSTPKWNTTYNYTFNLGNPIVDSADAIVKTTRFFVQEYSDHCYIKNVNTNLFLYTESSTGEITYRGQVGTYTTDGIVKINELTVVGLYDEKFELIYTPFSFDVASINNYIVRLPINLATINMIVDSTSMNSTSNQLHSFTGSR